MTNANQQLRAILAKEFTEAGRDRFFLLLTIFVAAAALASVLTGAIALKFDVATYESAKQTLLALGKSLSAIAAPEFYPLKLLRGAVEQIEIIGAVIGILIGFRSASSERERQRLVLLLSRPVSSGLFLLGKIIAGLTQISLSLGAVFITLTLALVISSGVPLGLDDLTRIVLTWGLSTLYIQFFFLLAFSLTLRLKRPGTAMLISFVVWLVFVLIAPQVGDTLDPDNQVAGGIFKQLHIPKSQQELIKQSYASYETLRNGIESASITKHFERATFAILGIKDTYTGKPIGPILTEKLADILALLIASLAALFATLLQPLNFERIEQEETL